VAEWRKVIPEGRDRLQSRVLVWVVGLLLVALGAGNLTSIVFDILNVVFSHLAEPRLRCEVEAFVISLTFAVLVWALRAATPMAAFFGGIISLSLTLDTQSVDDRIGGGIFPLTALFVLTFLATKLGRKRKEKAGIAEARRGRTASQIIANLGFAPLALVLSNFLDHDIRYFLYLAVLIEATADTVSSEIGQAFGGTPILLTTFKEVPAGTDGAVSGLGTAAGIVGGLIVSTVGMWAMNLPISLAGFALTGGIGGFFFDSFVGATIERRGWLGNDLVNFCSTIFSVLIALGLVLLVRGTILQHPFVLV